MNRSAKGFRVVGGIIILLNLIAFFMPLIKCTQTNYPTLQWSQMDYMTCLFRRQLPYMETQMSVAQIMWVLALVLLPTILVLVAGISGIVGGPKQIISSILIFTIFVLYIVMMATINTLMPKAVNGQEYSRGIACIIHLSVSGVGALLSIGSLVSTPKKATITQGSIPKVEEIKLQQVEAKYNIITGNSIPPVSQAPVEQPMSSVPVYVPGQPRGVMVGLTGMYAGAEIPFVNGEYIKLGRLSNNDLVFEGQPKVSRNHCRIKWNAERKKYTFCDFSSNGSFVNGSEDCLPQNLEIDMEVGTVIAIGDETNTFRLE